MATIKDALEQLNDKSVRHIVSISGGKDSAALAVHMKDKYPEIPVEYVFCDTGCELPETYEFIERLEALLGVSVIKVSIYDILKIPKKSRISAFDYMLKELYGDYLPSVRARWCTGALKIKPFEHFVGKGTAYSYIGIRDDEDREGYRKSKAPALSDRPNIIPVYPFKDDGITLSGVQKILENSGLGLPDYYKWRSRSGCYFCFYQQIGEWQGLKENHPELFEKAKAYETKDDGKRYTWVDGRSLEELEKLEKKYSIQSPEDTDSCAICHL